jgi:hypothetical protein
MAAVLLEEDFSAMDQAHRHVDSLVVDSLVGDWMEFEATVHAGGTHVDV